MGVGSSEVIGVYALEEGEREVEVEIEVVLRRALLRLVPSRETEVSVRLGSVGTGRKRSRIVVPVLAAFSRSRNVAPRALVLAFLLQGAAS